MNLFKPIIYKKDIYHIDYDQLYKKGIRYLIVDLDNTLGHINEAKCDVETKELINNLSKKFTIIVASNNKIKRVKKFCQDLNVIAFANSLKPSKKVYNYFNRKLGYHKDEVAVIGDQIVTDILMGNRVGILTILTDPLSNNDLKITFINRIIEKIILKIIKLKRGIYYAQD